MMADKGRVGVLSQVMQRVLICLFLCIQAVASAAWQAGAAKADITPTESVPLAGYGGKTRMSQRVEHSIWLKALALKDDAGVTSVLVTADLVGLSNKMIAVIAKKALEKHGIKPADGELLVTGANGGVGSVAIALLAGLGYQVVASTGRVSEAEHLKALGATSVIDRDELSAPGKPIGKERWAGVIDTVGSHTLANACATTRYRGAVAACGLAGGMDFPATVAPFILRGVTLYGIDSVMAPLAVRQEAWERLGRDLDLGKLDAMTREISLEEAIPVAAELLAGKVRGRVVVDVNR